MQETFCNIFFGVDPWSSLQEKSQDGHLTEAFNIAFKALCLAESSITKNQRAEILNK